MLRNTGQCWTFFGSEHNFLSNFYPVGLGLCLLHFDVRLRWNSVVFCVRIHTAWFTNRLIKAPVRSFLKRWQASTFRVSQKIKMFKEGVGDFQAIVANLKYSLSNALLLGGKGEMRGGHWGAATCEERAHRNLSTCQQTGCASPKLSLRGGNQVITFRPVLQLEEILPWFCIQADSVAPTPIEWHLQ